MQRSLSITTGATSRFGTICFHTVGALINGKAHIHQRRQRGSEMSV